MRNFLMTTVAAIGIATIAASAPAAQGGHGNNAAGGHGHGGLAHGAPGRSGPVHALADPVTADQPAASGLALDPAATNYAGDTQQPQVGAWTRVNGRLVWLYDGYPNGIQPFGEAARH